ncbi:MAG: hypothetical protein VKJ44_05095 [Synechococcus sp.]|nr:hypothetical protein [Synechococcus sp.]
MTRVLIVTVGGSPEPILKAVELHQPDELIFACSAPPCERPSLDQVIGAGTPCRHIVAGVEEWRPNLVTQLQLNGFREDLQLIGLPEPDDLSDCLQRLRGFVQSLRQRFSQLQLCGDFTGGTKSMSAALAFTLLDCSATVSVVSGRRDNLIRVERSEGLRVVNPVPLLAHRLIEEQLPPLLEAHFYDRARDLLVAFQRDQSERLSARQQQELSGLIHELEVLLLWDRCRWQDALDRAERIHFAASWPELWSWWLRVGAATDWDPHDTPAVAITGYELVQDLLLNAERRGHRGWYDDAVARLYRASELLAQTYIRLELGLAQPPAWTQRELQLASGEWFPNTGVSGLYRWLQEHEAVRHQGKGDRGLGSLCARQMRELRRLFNSRNASLLGHGLTPISQADWQSLQDRIGDLLTCMVEDLGIQQGASPSQLPGRLLLQHPALQSLLIPSSSP